MQEVDVVQGAEDDVAAGHARGGDGAGGCDPLHHAAAVNLSRRTGMLGKYSVDHFSGSFGDRWHRSTRGDANLLPSGLGQVQKDVTVYGSVSRSQVRTPR